MDTTTAGALGRLTMNPTVSATVAGDLATRWHRSDPVTIIQPVAVVSMLTDPRQHPTRCHLFRRVRVRAARVRAARDRAARDRVKVEVRRDKDAMSPYAQFPGEHDVTKI